MINSYTGLSTAGIKLNGSKPNLGLCMPLAHHQPATSLSTSSTNFLPNHPEDPPLLPLAQTFCAWRTLGKWNFCKAYNTTYSSNAQKCRFSHFGSRQASLTCVFPPIYCKDNDRSLPSCMCLGGARTLQAASSLQGTLHDPTFQF
jgi:hypothetical protein